MTADSNIETTFPHTIPAANRGSPLLLLLSVTAAACWSTPLSFQVSNSLRIRGGSFPSYSSSFSERVIMGEVVKVTYWAGGLPDCPLHVACNIRRSRGVCCPQGAGNASLYGAFSLPPTSSLRTSGSQAASRCLHSFPAASLPTSRREPAALRASFGCSAWNHLCVRTKDGHYFDASPFRCPLWRWTA